MRVAAIGGGGYAAPSVSTGPRTIRLRPWQKAALDAFEARPGPDFLAVATPGAGKTTLALAAARQDLAAHPGRRLVVVAPTQHLKGQWADAAERFGLHLDPEWAPGAGIPADVHGLVTTYQQVAGAAPALARVAGGSFAVLDEVHHAGDERAWGDGARQAFAGAAVRLALSGTPFRSDTRAIPFVAYDAGGEAEPDVEYGYGRALADRGVVRPVHFPRIGGEMEWIGADGEGAAASLDDAQDPVRSAQRQRTAQAPEGEWLPDVLGRAHARLREVRRSHPGAGGLVIAIDREHARAIAGIMARRLGVHPVVATSDDPQASARIAAFARGTDPWIVAVRMVSEGVDIPRLRVGVFATTTTTELFFRQAVGRLVRWTRGLGRQPSYMFIPDDPRLRGHAWAIAEERRHVLRRPGDEGVTSERDGLDEVPDRRESEQLSLFAAVSSRASDSEDVHRPEEALGLPHPDDPEDHEEVVLELMPAPHLGAGQAPEAWASEAPPRERRRALREANASLAKAIARMTGLSHAQVNAELNRRVGLRRIDEATLEQLERRRAQAARWLASA